MRDELVQAPSRVDVPRPVAGAVTGRRCRLACPASDGRPFREVATPPSSPDPPPPPPPTHGGVRVRSTAGSGQPDGTGRRDRETGPGQGDGPDGDLPGGVGAPSGGDRLVMTRPFGTSQACPCRPAPHHSTVARPPPLPAPTAAPSLTSQARCRRGRWRVRQGPVQGRSDNAYCLLAGQRDRDGKNRSQAYLPIS